MTDTVQAIAKALGDDWSVQPADGADDEMLRRANGEVIRVSTVGARLRLRGEPGDLLAFWPREENDPLTHQITVSASRPPAVLARVVETRLLSGYRKARQSALDRRMVIYPEQERLAAEVASILRADRLDRVSDPSRRPGVALHGPSIHGEVRADVETVTFHLGVSATLAVTLAACVATLGAAPESLAADARDHGRAACWYAWGATDHGISLTGTAPSGVSPAVAFGLAYAAAQAATAAGGRAFLPSIQDAFARWQNRAEF
ncbi:hypothetical protein [Frankia sp. AiPa1]|uniref:hypothetical protein n=1 Tax=Frankia sp. AiPa1 TaxID=573492 RepID=UPI00202B3830|nr:hypothetical protein [Frankia sp. AiPa1]MCL9758632.1 hypothetical protein [Frankia sp. AiPa1]